MEGEDWVKEEQQEERKRVGGEGLSTGSVNQFCFGKTAQLLLWLGRSPRAGRGTRLYRLFRFWELFFLKVSLRYMRTCEHRRPKPLIL